MLPDFIVIGNLRSGTTWLHHCLREHPEVFLPRHVKGTHFFSHRFHKGLAWYESHFEDRGDEKAVGEVSPLCLGSRCAARNIRQTIPGAAIIACLRDPMTSVWSHYLRELRQGRTRRPFRDALEEDPEIYEYHLHHRNLGRYLELFSRDQILIVFHDDIAGGGEALLRDVFRFLGVREDFRPTVASRRINEAMVIRFLALARPIARLRWKLRDRKMYRVVEWTKRLGLVDFFFGVGAPGDAIYSRKDREWVRELYLEDTERLADLTGRNLDHWLHIDGGPPGPFGVSGG